MRGAGRDLALILGIGPMFGAATLLGYAGGSYLDERFGVAPWGVVLGVTLGAAAGFREIAKVLRALRKPDGRRKRPTGEPGDGQASGDDEVGS